MEAGYLKKQAEAKIVDLFKNKKREDCSLGELVRKGVRLMLETALEMEGEEFLGCARYERSEGKRKGYRNGVRVRRVKTLGGEVEIRKPKVRDTEEPFRSQILRAWQRRCDELSELIPSLYLEGVSTRDFQRVLGTFWGETGFSKSTISRLNKRLHEEFEAWRRRELSKEWLVFLYLDALYAGVRYGTSEKEAVMIAHGIREDGRRSVLSVRFGGRESTANWAEVLHDLEARNLPRPLLVISDGNAGLIRAIEATWPGIPRQRCVHHRKGNILQKVPKGAQEEVGKALNAIWNADTLKEAKEAARCFVKQYGRRYESATECLLEFLPECLTLSIIHILVSSGRRDFLGLPLSMGRGVRQRLRWREPV